MFSDGDQIIGNYGNSWTRKNGGWYDDRTGYGPSKDDTMHYLLDVLNKIPTPKVEYHDRKISKSQKQPPEGYKFRFRLDKHS